MSSQHDSPGVPERTIALRLNGEARTLLIEDRQLLVNVIRESAGLTGTHVGCYGGDCGACTVEIDGRIAKSCLVLGASVHGCEVTTIEGIGGEDGLDEIQLAFWEADAFQCGFCLPGHLFSVRDLLRRDLDPSEEDVRRALIGNLCRCTGYVTIVDAALEAARRARAHARGLE
jgi:aerobic-type carbon monoxide dehydrogenase small subunit (CoxS/CutS family)